MSDLDIYQMKNGSWRWRVGPRHDPIAESNASFLSRENCINNLLLLNQVVNNLVGRAAQQHFAREASMPQGQLQPTPKEKKP